MNGGSNCVFKPLSDQLAALRRFQRFTYYFMPFAVKLKVEKIMNFSNIKCRFVYSARSTTSCVPSRDTRYSGLNKQIKSTSSAIRCIFFTISRVLTWFIYVTYLAHLFTVASVKYSKTECQRKELLPVTTNVSRHVIWRRKHPVMVQAEMAATLGFFGTNGPMRSRMGFSGWKTC